MKKALHALAAAGLCALLALTGCSQTSQSAADQSQTKQSSAQLDPNNPVTLTVWHYYNGAQQAAFDSLISEFNAGVGKEKGIYVEGYTQGSVSDLEQAVTDSAAGVVGSKAMPDIFSSYADTAYELEKADRLADLTNYFTQDELDQYVAGYINEGYFEQDGKLYLFPVAKSTEITMVNTTDWEPFAQATGATLDQFSTFEGITALAKQYYEWTDAQTPDVPNDGRALFGRDSLSNYFVIGCKQLGVDLFDVSGGSVTINANKTAIRRLWDNYYVPYINGWFDSYGKFRSDDVKTGDILAYTGSSSSAAYFPDQVVEDDGNHDIDYAVLMPPVFEGATNVCVQQGAGMCVTKSDELHELASCEFLRWFTQAENNLTFASTSSYLPVRNDANTVEALDSVIASKGLSVTGKTYDCLKTVMQNFDSTEFYSTPCFENGYQTRGCLSTVLSEKAQADREAVDAAAAAGANRAEAAATYDTDENFEAWYAQLVSTLESKAHPAATN